MSVHSHHASDPLILKEQLKKIGARFTKVRKTILDILSHHKEPISVPEILECLSHEDINVNKTTAYRELDFLLEQGMIHELDFGDRKKRYELSSRTHHHHLICQECHSIEDITLEEELKKEEDMIMQKKGFTVLKHHLEFFGICKTCRK